MTERNIPESLRASEVVGRLTILEGYKLMMLLVKGWGLVPEDVKAQMHEERPELFQPARVYADGGIKYDWEDDA